jgi:LysM repeat protein
MADRNPARFLAPIALVVALVGAYLIVHHNTSTKHTSSTQPAPTARARTASQRRYARAKFYVVQAGDILSKISSKTGVSLPRIESLNPTLDPNSLQAGQKLRLRR